MVLPIPCAASVSPAIHTPQGRYAVVYAWLTGGQIHLYFQLLSPDFFVVPAGWTCYCTDGTVEKARAVVTPDGTRYEGYGVWEFSEDAEAILEFPDNVNLNGTDPVVLQGGYTVQAGFSLLPISGKQLSIIGPETEQMVRDIVTDTLASSSVHLYQYFNLLLFDKTGIAVHFYSVEDPATFLAHTTEDGTPFSDIYRFEQSKGLILDREKYKHLNPWVTDP